MQLPRVKRKAKCDPAILVTGMDSNRLFWLVVHCKICRGKKGYSPIVENNPTPTKRSFG